MLDHIGKPAIKAGRCDPWRQHMKELAALPNVFCKISGVATEADHRNWTREQLKPYIAHAIECFGFDRIHVRRRLARARSSPCTYPEWVDIVDWVIEGASAEEKRKLFRDNAIRLLPPRPMSADAADALKQRVSTSPRCASSRARPAAAGLRFRRRRGGGRADARAATRPRSTTSSSCRTRCAGSPSATSRSSSSASGWPAGHHRADRPRRAVLARRRSSAARAPPPRPAPPSASATARSARSRSSRRPASPRAGCRSSSTATAASRASSPSAPPAAGYDALVLTIDNQMIGNRERDIRNGFTIPPRSEPTRSRGWR